MLLGSPLCITFDDKFHLAGLIQLQSYSTQDIDSCIKIFRILPDCCKRSTPSSLSGTWMTLPSLREVCNLVFLLDALLPCVLPHQRAEIWPQMFSNLWCAQHSTPLHFSALVSTVPRC